MSRLKNFRIDRIGVWISKKELNQLRDDVDASPDVRTIAGDLIDKIDKYEPIPMDPDMKEPAEELQQRLMQCTIDFFKEKGIEDIWSVGWDVDDLMSSVKEGKWVPYSDSSITLERLTSDGRIPVAFVI